MKKLLAMLMLAAATVAPAQAGDRYVNACEAREDGSRLFNSRNLKDLNVWSGHVVPSRLFMVKRTPDKLHWQGDLTYPAPLLGVIVSNVWILSTEWDCER